MVGLFGAALIDSTTEIDPTRPYSAVFAPAIIGIEHTRGSMIQSSAPMGSLFDILLFFVIGASLLGVIANSTTGITIAHTGFTPNVNLTSSPGAVSIVKILPLIFVAIIAFAGFKKLQAET